MIYIIFSTVRGKDLANSITLTVKIDPPSAVDLARRLVSGAGARIGCRWKRSGVSLCSRVKRYTGAREHLSAAKYSTDYDRVSKAIAFLRAHRRQQPDLAALSAHLALSEFHVQRLFSRWAGVSPKRFLQFLTVEYAKRRMEDSANLLHVAFDAGLSGPGRLHDLFVTMEGMSPGEFKRAATGLTISYGIAETPFGPALIAATDRGVCHLAFIDSRARGAAIRDLRDKWLTAEFVHQPKQSAALLARIFDRKGGRRDKSPSLWVSGSNFQIQVWRALLRIPFAHLLNYRQLAEYLGQPEAARAVGNAIACNPVAYLIPCHRVLRQSGDFGKYHWGEDRKAAMVAWEAANNDISVSTTDAFD